MPGGLRNGSQCKRSAVGFAPSDRTTGSAMASAVSRMARPRAPAEERQDKIFRGQRAVLTWVRGYTLSGRWRFQRLRLRLSVRLVVGMQAMPTRRSPASTAGLLADANSPTPGSLATAAGCVAVRLAIKRSSDPLRDRLTVMEQSFSIVRGHLHLLCNAFLVGFHGLGDGTGPGQFRR